MAGQQFRGAIKNAHGGSATIALDVGGVTEASGVSVSAAVAAANISEHNGTAARTLMALETNRINFADYTGTDPTWAAMTRP